MNKSLLIWIVVAVVILGGLWWWMSMSGNPATAPVSPTGQPAAGSGNVVPPVAILGTATNATLGTFLVASNGMTLYTFSKDKPNVSNCSGQCAALWPPYMASSSMALSGGAGVTGSITTITRTDGTLQITYNGVPLYFYEPDVKVGDTTGQGFGGLWFVRHP